MAQCVRPEVRHVLDGTTLTSTRVDGTDETVRLAPGEVPKVLEEVFGIVLDEQDTARLVEVLVAGWPWWPSSCSGHRPLSWQNARYPSFHPVKIG